MNKIYYCHNCNCYIDETEVTTEKVDLENMYGVGEEFADHHYGEQECCWNCGSTELEELEYYDVIDILNSQEKENRKLKRKIKELEGK